MVHHETLAKQDHMNGKRDVGVVGYLHESRRRSWTHWIEIEVKP